MTMWTYVGLSLIVISAVFVFPNVFAFEFYEKTEWLGVDEEPKFCLVEESLDVDFMDNKDMFESITKNAILGWENELKQDSGNQDAWDIDYEYVRVDDSENPLYTKNCDVYIYFYNAIDEYGTIGITFVMEELESPTIWISYLAVEYVEVECVPELYVCLSETYFETEITNFFVEEKRMEKTLQHEMGHAFGLGHFLTNDSLLLDAWDNGLKKPPSLMIEYEPLIGYYEITDLDTEKMFSIYGKDGFTKSKKSIPEWIKNNAEWWSQGLISDEEYLNAVEFLIKEGIIRV